MINADENERKQNEAFKKWMNSKDFITTPERLKIQLCDYVEALNREIADLQRDKERIDWLADVNNKDASVMLPTSVVEAEIMGGLRGMIDFVMSDN